MNPPDFKPGDELHLAVVYLSRLYYALFGAICVVLTAVGAGGAVYYNTRSVAGLIPLLMAVWPIDDIQTLVADIARVNARIRALRKMR